MSGEDRIRIGVSACLLGREVRYDGGHKRDAFLTETLGRFVEWVPVCPEVELGLGVPRAPLHLEREGDALRLVEEGTGRDLWPAMRRFAELRVAELARQGLSGYVLKSRSPSCGMGGVEVRGARGAPGPPERGVFAAALLEAFPDLPVEEEGRLQEAALREKWIERVIAYHRDHYGSRR